MKIVVLSSHTPSLFWFRMDMMKAFLDKGYEVTAFGPEEESKWQGQFLEHNIQYRKLSVERNGVNPFRDLNTYKELKSFLKEEKPDKIFTYQAKTIVYGALAARSSGIKEVYPLIAGLGSVFIGKGLKNKIIRTIMKIQYYLAFKASKKVFFQNHDDKNVFLKGRLLREEKIVMIHGSGVNVEKFSKVPLPEQQGFLYIGRLIKDKGITEYLEACKQIKEKHPDVRCLLVGPYDSNPTSLKEEELQPYIKQYGIEYFGEQTDVRPYIKMCSVYVLPSYHEGTPKTVLESMAMGRAILTSDAPGCRETVQNGVNGYLIPIKNVDALVEKMEYLLQNEELCKGMGEKSRVAVEEKYDVHLVNQKICNTMNL